MTSHPEAPQEPGGLLMIGLPGLELDASTRRLITEDRVNHFILFRRNVGSPEQLRGLCQALRQLCADQGLGSPLIAIDQEGGSVTRLPPPFTQFGHARDLAAGSNPEEQLTSYARTCGRELRQTGINMNLAPVLDVCPAGQKLFMEKRALGGDPATVARLGGLVITEMQSQGVAACGKHFPGLGSAGQDPHLLLPTVLADGDQLQTVDLAPFKAVMNIGVAALMTSHTIYPALDPDTPATLSAIILQKMLRDELGYDGLLLTDDLEMGAIENHWTVAQAALQALLAGADILLICQDHEKIRQTISLLRQAQVDGRIPPGRLGRSLRRIADVAKKFG